MSPFTSTAKVRYVLGRPESVFLSQTCFFTTMHLHANVKPSPWNVSVYISTEQNGSYVIRQNNIKQKRKKETFRTTWYHSPYKRFKNIVPVYKGDDSERPFGCYEKGLGYKNNSETLVYQDREWRWLLKDRDGTVVMAATRLPHQTAVGPTFLPISIAIPLPSSSEPAL